MRVLRAMPFQMLIYALSRHFLITIPTPSPGLEARLRSSVSASVALGVVLAVFAPRQFHMSRAHFLIENIYQSRKKHVLLSRNVLARELKNKKGATGSDQE